MQSTLKMIKDARDRGLRAPVLLMGYYNPLLSYGEDRLLKDCQESGVNGFIVVDLPPEEAVSFRKLCSRGG
jgi:tryptophan synthase